MLIINKGEEKLRVDYKKGDLLSDAISKVAHINLVCGGFGSCGQCGVIVLEGEFLSNQKLLKINKQEPSQKLLSCSTSIESDYAEVEIITTVAKKGKIETEFHLKTIETKDSSVGYGLAIDIGTTTVAVSLVDLKTGRIISNDSMYNQQISRGLDVSSRISFSMEEGNLEKLQKLVVEETINEIIKKIVKKESIDCDKIISVAISANTVMSHILCGISPKSIGTYPFTPATKIYNKTAVDLNLITKKASVYILPSVSGYIGGDIVADIIVAKMKEAKKTTIMIDLGTNTETVFALNGKLIATTAAAGPSFEGAGLACGCMAVSGAIDKISIDDSLEFTIDTIGNSKPKGICGTGIVDFLSEAYEQEIVNELGRFDIDLLKKIGKHEIIEKDDKKLHACILAEGVFVTEYDIEQILKAKAAIYSGMQSMLEDYKIPISQIDKIILSGGFAKHLSIENAIKIGMLLDVDMAKYETIGNGSLAGAYLYLQNKSVKLEYEDILEQVEVIELNKIKSFESNFIDALLLP